MPGLISDSPESAIVPFAPDPPTPVIIPLRVGLKPPVFRIRVNWTRGNLLHVACFSGDAAVSGGGKVVEVELGGGGDGEIGEVERRRIAYGSVPAFALLQSRRNSLMAMARMSASSAAFRNEWWQHVLEYSNQISNLLGPPKPPSDSLFEDPMVVLQPIGKPTSLKAAWQLLEIFYVDRLSSAWLPERLADWLADYDSLLSETEMTVHSKLVMLQKKLANLQVVEDEPEYWEGISLALSVGWLEIVVKLLRLHGSYQLDQIDDRETENGLVEAVAVVVSTMPRMRPDLLPGKLGQCYKTKSDFIKAWEKWRGQISKLDCSAFWVQCGHHRTREGLRSLLQIMLGNLNSITAATCHWMELCISQLLYMRPFTMGLEALHTLVQKCMQLKPITNSSGLMGIIHGILGENIEVVLAECSNSFGSWMVTHATELLTAENDQADILLHEERYNLGGISMDELHRLVYAQVLSSHPLTWQSLEALHSLVQKCMQLKPITNSSGLMGILHGIIGESIEVVLAECSNSFGPWMVTHATELLTAENDQADILLHEGRYNLGGISMDELHRLVYAQVLSSHPLTWQIAPTYLVSCPKQGLGLLENLLYKQPVQHYHMILKNLEICRLYELDNISSSVMKIAGMYHWKHGMKGFGIYWLQLAQDEDKLNRIAQQLFDCIGKSVSDDSFKHWEGLIELLGSEVGTAGGLEFLHKYRDFKRSLQQVLDGRASDVAPQTVESLIQLMRSPSTPERFWLPLLHDSVKLLNWRDRPLLNVSETSLLLNKLQELSLAKLRPDFSDSKLPPQALNSVRLALAMNLGRAILEEP